MRILKCSMIGYLKFFSKRIIYIFQNISKYLKIIRNDIKFRDSYYFKIHLCWAIVYILTEFNFIVWENLIKIYVHLTITTIKIENILISPKCFFMPLCIQCPPLISSPSTDLLIKFPYTVWLFLNCYIYTYI